ncbi:MAG TPA: hypothetical protein VL095_14170 [Flavisolibacter sp.]|nr:hypothetical protein [Flavisolibacter sp.]
MFTGISWTDYMVVVAITLALYYCCVAIRYYSEELKDIISGKSKLNFRMLLPPKKQSEELGNLLSESRSFDQTRDDEFIEVEELIAKLKEVIVLASKKSYVIQEFKQFLRLVFREHPHIKESPFRSSINELVVSECEKHGTVALSEEEVDRLWLETV